MGSRSENLRPWRVDTAGGMLIEWDLGIGMDDGLVLRADIFRPAAPGRYPVILSYGPYAKGLPFQQGYPDQWRRLTDAHPEVARGSSGRYQNWEAVDPEKWVPAGYACVFWDNWMKKQVITVQHGLGDRGPVNPNTGQPVAGPETLPEAELAANRADLRRAILSHPLDGEYHRERSPVWSRITVPLLSAANWGGQGLHPRGNFEGFMRAASPEKWLEVHGLEHWTEFYTDYGLGLQKRFFDHYLKGADNGWERQPRVLLQIRHVDRFVPRAEEAWPVPRTRWTRFYLDAAARTLAPQPGARAGAVEFDALGD